MSTARTVLAIAAHPDDEVLGVGATLARHAREGDAVHILIVAEGATSRDDSRDAQARGGELEALRDAARAAASCLGAHPPRFLGLPDNRLDGLDLLDVVKAMEAVVDEVKPDIVYTHHGGDLNVDHRVVHQAALTACRPLPGAGVREVLAFETVSSTEWGGAQTGGVFVPQRYVDVSTVWDAKLKALEAYALEMRPFPHARSVEAVEALARVRGAQAGLKAAEAFSVIREVRS